MPAYCCGWRTVVIAGLLLMGGAVSLYLVNGTGLLPCPAGQPTKVGGDWPMFGGSPARNMANPAARNTPVEWQTEGGLKNIRWVAPLGTTSYGGPPVVAQGKVLVGTNNQRPRDPNAKGNKAVLMCFNEKDGKLLWQALHDMPAPEVAREAIEDGLCAAPAVAGDRLYYVTPAAVVVCADLTTGKSLWQLDMMKELKVYPAWVNSCSPLVVGDLVFVVTGNGTDAEGKLVAPEAPSFVAVNKKDGTVKWQSNLPGKNIFEGQWSNPAHAEVNGKGQVIFPGGDSWLYGLEPETGQLLWKFHCLPQKEVAAAKKRNGLPNQIVATPVVHDKKVYVGVGLYPGHGESNKVGHFWCVDLVRATQNAVKNPEKDVSPKDDNFDPRAPENQDSALAWHYGGEIFPKPKLGQRTVHFGKTFSTAAVQDGLVYVTEEMGYLHCLDAATGQPYWVHDFMTGTWSSPFWADGKIYVGTEDGEVVIFAHGREKKLLNTILMEEPVLMAPTAVNRTLFLMTQTQLFAIGGK